MWPVGLTPVARTSQVLEVLQSGEAYCWWASTLSTQLSFFPLVTFFCLLLFFPLPSAHRFVGLTFIYRDAHFKSLHFKKQTHQLMPSAWSLWSSEHYLELHGNPTCAFPPPAVCSLTAQIMASSWFNSSLISSFHFIQNCSSLGCYCFCLPYPLTGSLHGLLLSPALLINSLSLYLRYFWQSFECLFFFFFFFFFFL